MTALFDYSRAVPPDEKPVYKGDFGGDGGVLPSGSKSDPIFTVSVIPQYVPTGFVDVDTNLPLLAEVACENGVLTVPYPLGYINQNGEFILSTSSSVGANATPPLTQLVGTYHFDLAGLDSPVGESAQTIMERAEAQGVLIRDAFGAERRVTREDLLVKIDMDLKPIGGHGNVGGAQITATSSDAWFHDGAEQTDLDAGGSRTAGELLGSGFYIKCGFEELEVAAGSVATISVVLASRPA